MRFLQLIKPVMCILPEVAQPDRKVGFDCLSLICDGNGGLMCADDVVDSFPRKGPLDDRDAVHFLGLLPDSFVRCGGVEVIGPFLLDARDSGV